MGDSIDEKGQNQTFTVLKPTLTKTAHFQTHFSNAYKRYRPYAICNMHYKYILLRTSYGSDPNPCIMRYMQYDLMHYEQVYCIMLNSRRITYCIFMGEGGKRKKSLLHDHAIKGVKGKVGSLFEVLSHTTER
jgi:hypothetical protein